MSHGRRASERSSQHGRPNFKEMSGGRQSRNNGDSNKTSRKVLLWEGLSCNLYEEIMQHMRNYEKIFDCKLNASMVTLKLRQGRPDYLYYRSITFWCSYCIQSGKPLMSPSLGIAQRFCPFLVVVNGDANKEALVMTQIYPDHQHLPHVSTEVSSKEATPQQFNAIPSPPNPAHSVTVPANDDIPKEKDKSISPKSKKSSVSETSRPNNLKRASNSNGLPDALKRPSTSYVINKSASYSQPVTKAANGPTALKAKSSQQNTKARVAPTTNANCDEDVLPIDVECQLCAYKTRSRNAFCGHVWLAHKLLTDFMIF